MCTCSLCWGRGHNSGYTSSLQLYIYIYNNIYIYKRLSLARLLHHEVHFLDDTRPALEWWVFKCASKCVMAPGNRKYRNRAFRLFSSCTSEADLCNDTTTTVSKCFKPFCSGLGASASRRRQRQRVQSEVARRLLTMTDMSQCPSLDARGRRRRLWHLWHHQKLQYYQPELLGCRKLYNSGQRQLSSLNFAAFGMWCMKHIASFPFWQVLQAVLQLTKGAWTEGSAESMPPVSSVSSHVRYQHQYGMDWPRLVMFWDACSLVMFCDVSWCFVECLKVQLCNDSPGSWSLWPAVLLRSSTTGTHCKAEDPSAWECWNSGSM